MRAWAEAPYYDRLREYFPAHELKDRRQIEDLLAHSPVYRKLETEDALVLYAQFPDFLFVDYLLVDPAMRRKGIGTSVLSQLKSHEKPLMLEVEPQDPDDADTVLRRKFYQRHGFQQADGVVYRRTNPRGQPFKMDLLLWFPAASVHWDRQTTKAMMQRVLAEVHGFHASRYYPPPADPGEVVLVDPALR